MVSDAVGEYYYNYTISSSATYGRYTSKVTVASAGGNIAVYKDEFYVMPWEAVTDLRQTMGLSNDTKSISDDDLSNIIWNCYQWALKDIYIHHHNEHPSSNPSTGILWDGSNKLYKTSHYPIADSNGDGTVSGNQYSCVTDISGFYIDDDGHYNKAVVKVRNATNGEIYIYKSDGVTPIPSVIDDLLIDYWSEPPEFDTFVFQQAVVLLAAHEVSNRLINIDKVNISDLYTNNPLVVINPQRFMNEYRRYMGLIREPVIGGVKARLE